MVKSEITEINDNYPKLENLSRPLIMNTIIYVKNDNVGLKIFCELKKCIQNKTHWQTNEMLYHRRAKWGREDNIR